MLPPIEAAVPNVKLPLAAAALLLVLINAPPLLIPVPLIVILLVIVWPLRFKTALVADTTIAPVPNGPEAGEAMLLEPAIKVPPLMVVVPP